MRNVIVAILSLIAAGAAAAQEVSVYVSLDEQHSRRVLDDFAKETGIRVVPLFDTEANKTVGLMRRILAEKSDPQADVFWNNELATMIKLKEAGALQP